MRVLWVGGSLRPDVPYYLQTGPVGCTTVPEQKDSTSEEYYGRQTLRVEGFLVLLVTTGDNGG